MVYYSASSFLRSRISLYLSYLASLGDRVEKTTLSKFNDLLGVELARAENFVKNKSITSIQRKHEFLYNPPKA